VRLVDCDIRVDRHDHPSAGGKLSGELLATLDTAGIVAKLDEDGNIVDLATGTFDELPVVALTALADTGRVRPGSWVRFDSGEFTFRVVFRSRHLFALEHEGRT
jgi:hypothetical protein